MLLFKMRYSFVNKLLQATSLIEISSLRVATVVVHFENKRK